jgi:hypothetical protein
MARKTTVADIRAATGKLALTEIRDGPLQVKLASIASLSLIPWFCDCSVQYALVLDTGGVKLPLGPLRELEGPALAQVGSRTELGIPGGGDRSAAELLRQTLGLLDPPKGTQIELAAANTGYLQRERVVKAETDHIAGNQRYAGTVLKRGLWSIERSHPALSAEQLSQALQFCGAVLKPGSLKGQDASEAAAALELAQKSMVADLSEYAFSKLKLDGAAIRMPRDLKPKREAVALMLFRLRFADGPWDVKTARAADEKRRQTYQASGDEMGKIVARDAARIRRLDEELKRMLKEEGPGS